MLFVLMSAFDVHLNVSVYAVSLRCPFMPARRAAFLWCSGATALGLVFLFTTRNLFVLASFSAKCDNGRHGSCAASVKEQFGSLYWFLPRRS
jgi:hypothetical protein